MANWVEKLAVAHQYQSWASISRETGMSMRTLTAIRTGSRQPPQNYIRSLNNVWARSSYSWMRSVGVPTLQRAKYRGGGYESVAGLHDTSVKILNFMARGAAVIKFAHLKQPMKSSLYRQYIEDVKPSILKGMDKSRVNIEEMPADYGYLDKFLAENPGFEAIPF